jgi:hypothetical protein
MILLPLAATSMWSDPFTDYLNVTVPLDCVDPLTDQLMPILDVLGATEASPGLFKLPDSRASFKVHRRGKVGIFSASGGLLAAIRARDLFSEYLRDLGSFPHRVSMLHATQDYIVADPAPVIQEVRRLGQLGELALTRKRILPTQVKSILTVGFHGVETGTVYLGHRANADVWAKVYDKQEEQLSRGFPDPGPLVRVEIAVQSDVGATLRDAADPSSIFFHFGARSLVESPVGVAPWVPYGDGYIPSPSRFNPTALQRIEAILESSADFARVLRIGRSEFGEGVFEAILPTLRRRCALREAL